MKRLLLFASKLGYQIRQFEQAARRVGAEVTLATDRCGHLEDPWGDHAVAVKFDKPAPAIEALKGTGSDGVAAVGDRPALLAAEVAEAFGLPFHTPAAARAALDKSLARSVLHGKVQAARTFSIETAEFPCVVKPVGQSASKGVIRANNQAELVQAVERIRRMGEKQVLAEEYIPGREYAIEGVSTHGEFRPLAIFDKPEPLEGPYFEETIYTTPSRASEAVQRELVETTAEAVRVLGLRHGPVHAELRHNDRGVWFLEAHARPIGGLCSNAVRLDGGMPLEEFLVRHALGEDVSGRQREAFASGVMMIPIPHAGLYRSVDGVEQARQVQYVEDVMITATQGQRLLPLPEGSSYLGFIFARGNTLPAFIESALWRAHGKLRFEILTALETMTLPREGH